ncbi:pyridoxal kinase PdxY [Propionibacteriaceae bacterium Y1685]|uniref:pyridoxal kinase PdxY n=1 Tax=Microlunatus sp. Y1700 TaxID=3418487 RepID=UPI003B8066E7
MTTILSIQSSVAYGHAGNSAATFPLMRQGVEVWPVLTVHFSNHTGYGAWRGPLFPATAVADVVTGIDERGVLDRCDAVLSGYQGAEDVGQVVLDAAALVKQRNPDAIYCCDPVLGDVDRGFFVRPGIPEFMRDQVVPAADLITPNLFELEFLTGQQARTTAELLAAADRARAMGPELVLITSALHEETAPGELDMVVVSGRGAWIVSTPRLEFGMLSGCGDMTSATFLAHWLATGDEAAALSRTASIVYGVLKITSDAGAEELRLVEAQDEFVTPTHTFTARRLR